MIVFEEVEASAMPAARKYLDELRERAVRLVFERGLRLYPCNHSSTSAACPAGD